MTRNLALAVVLFVAACGQQGDNSPAKNAMTKESAAPARPEEVPALDGQWRVVSIDGKPVGDGSAMTVEFGAGDAVIAAGCLRRAWTYTQSRNIVSFATNSAGSANCGGRAPNAEQESAYAALEQATMAIFSQKGDRANLSGTGGNLALERR